MSYSVSPITFKILGALLILVGLIFIFGSYVGGSLFTLFSLAGLIIIIVGIFVLGIKIEKK